jgi:hypothetical protein
MVIMEMCFQFLPEKVRGSKPLDTFLVRYFFVFSIQYQSIGSESLQYDIRYSDTFLVRYFDTFFCIR